MPEVDSAKCDGCGLCLKVCRCGALVMVNNRVTVVETKDCHWCTECEGICPKGAISCPFEIVFEQSGRSAESQ